MKFIVCGNNGQPLKLGGFKYAVEAIAAPVDLLDATRFDDPRTAEREARRMMNLNGFTIRLLVPLDQQ